MSKSDWLSPKLSQLDLKGEAVKAEICGTVLAVRLRKYIEKHSGIEIDRWFHLLDGHTVLGAIQRDNYGYQTFFCKQRWRDSESRVC